MHDHDVGGEIGVAGRLEKPRLLERMDIKKRPEAAIAVRYEPEQTADDAQKHRYEM